MDVELERTNLIRELQNDISDKKVLDVMARIPRESFVPDEYRNAAYANQPLPIGHGQTISQPLMIALMTQALDLEGHETVLEIGTGSGYQTAILAELAKTVVTVERVPELLDSAKATLLKLGYNNIVFHPAGEELGWSQEAPYDGIIVTAGAPRVPEKLVAQLKTGGRLIIPVGPKYLQECQKVVRLPGGNRVFSLGNCNFVSLIGKDAWQE